jgi:hypothetical protein
MIRRFYALPCFGTNAGIVVACELLQQFRGVDFYHPIILSQY